MFVWVVARVLFSMHLLKGIANSPSVLLHYEFISNIWWVSEWEQVSNCRMNLKYSIWIDFLIYLNKYVNRNKIFLWDSKGLCLLVVVITVVFIAFYAVRLLMYSFSKLPLSTQCARIQVLNSGISQTKDTSYRTKVFLRQAGGYNITGWVLWSRDTQGTAEARRGDLAVSIHMCAHTHAPCSWVFGSA